MRDGETLGGKRQPQRGRHGAGLCGDAQGGRGLERRHLQRLVAQRGAAGEVDEADAVGPEDRDTAFFRRLDQRVLRGAAFFAGLRKTGGKDHGAGNPAPTARRDRICGGNLRNGQHSRIDPVRQVVDGRHAGQAADLFAAARDEMDIAFEAELPEVMEDRAPQRAGLRRDADDRDRVGPNQPRDAVFPFRHREGLRVALVVAEAGPVESDPGDAALDLDKNGIAPGLGGIGHGTPFDR